MMTNSDPEGRIFQSHSHTNNGFFFLPTIKYHILCFKKDPLLEVPEHAEMRHNKMASLLHNNDVT